MKKMLAVPKQYLFGIAVAAIFLLAGCTASGQTATSETTAVSPNRSITVVGSGEATGKPDQAQVQIGVDTVAQTVAQATAQNQRAVTAVLSAIKAQNVADSDIQTSNYSVWAEQNTNADGATIITAYHVSNQVNVTIRNIDTVDQIIGAATEAGANNIYGVSFTVNDFSALEEQARQEAIADAQSRAGDLASLTNVSLGDVLVVSEVIGNPGVQPLGFGGGLAAVADPTISPGQLTYQVQVQVTYAIK
jgi:uncharacterized protein YggE